jgi:hypothetical protein
MWGWLPCCSVLSLSLLPVPGTVFLFLLWWGGIVCWHSPTLPASTIHLGYNSGAGHGSDLWFPSAHCWSDTACKIHAVSCPLGIPILPTRSPCCTVASHRSPSGSQGLPVVWWGLPFLSQEHEGRGGKGTGGRKKPLRIESDAQGWSAGFMARVYCHTGRTVIALGFFGAGSG